MRQGAKSIFATMVVLIALAGSAGAWEPLAVSEDPLVRMPGSQPSDGIAIESPNRCLNCHAGYFEEGEPGANWRGSMMAQAARDPLFWAAVTVAAQDSIWAVGRPNATDICLRCHLPEGWLEGRSDPTNASAMSGSDFDGVSCDVCHRMYDPFFETTHQGVREGSDWLDYWDETNASATPSQPAADATRAADAAESAAARRYSGQPFYGQGLPNDNLPFSPLYDENGGGQFFVSVGNQKRASFADADARHAMLYSRYHKSKFFCSSCHDVSNPVLANLAFDGTPPGDGTTVLPTEESPAYSYFHVERTFSEFMLSDYGLQGGAAGVGPFAPEVFTTSTADNFISRCQDCHMPDVVGRGANKNGAVLRPTESLEHPESGLPQHDMTGGNVWIPAILASTLPGSPNYDPVNQALLGQGAAVLTLDLATGQGLDDGALLDAAERAEETLERAAAFEDLSYDSTTGALAFKVRNHTGHKLISGYPEGRRMFVNIRAYDAGDNLIHEVNPYDAAAGTLKGLGQYSYVDSYPAFEGPLPSPAALTGAESYLDELVYEAHTRSSLTGEDETFHFALADGRAKDNRIPPKGFRIAEAGERLIEPVWQGVVDPGYFTAAEYAGGYDDVSLTIATGAARVEVSLYYQTTSREYIEFLRDEIDGTATSLPGNGAGGDPAYLAQSDPFFAALRAWGETIWKLWKHNKDLAGAAPVLMTQATVNVTPPQCTPPVPTLLSAVPGVEQVTLAWSDEHTGDPEVLGYAVYYDESGSAVPVAETGPITGYTDSELSGGEQVCYKVTSRYAECQSDFSNILCAVPTAQPEAGVVFMLTARLDGGIVPTDTFVPGETIIILNVLRDTGTGLPLVDAVVDLTVEGPVNLDLTSLASFGQGIAPAPWGTPPGVPTGSYTAKVTNVTAAGYVWNGVETSVPFTIQAAPPSAELQ